MSFGGYHLITQHTRAEPRFLAHAPIDILRILRDDARFNRLLIPHPIIWQPLAIIFDEQFRLPAPEDPAGLLLVRDDLGGPPVLVEHLVRGIVRVPRVGLGRQTPLADNERPAAIPGDVVFARGGEVGVLIKWDTV